MTTVIEDARRRAGLTKDELAQRAGTSRPTLSAYVHGRKSPRLDTAERIVREAGFELTVSPRLAWRTIRTRHRRVASVPDRLPSLDPADALAVLELPLHLDWSRPDRHVDLRDPQQRARCYESVLREGTPEDIAGIVDGAFLVDLFDDLVLPAQIRLAWEETVEATLGR
jgi:transcriptional regulator with XRE-family HTH domain